MTPREAIALAIILALLFLLRTIRRTRQLTAMRHFYTRRANRQVGLSILMTDTWTGQYPMPPEQVLE